MSLSKADWLALRTPVAVMLGVALCGALLVAGTHAALKKTNVSVTASERSLKEARDQLFKSGEEKNRILRYNRSYTDLQRTGFVGEEERINWVDALRATSLQLKLFGVNYQIAARQAYKPQGLPDTGHFYLYRSTMKLELGLLHEEDLMRFIDALARQQVGVFLLQACSLQNSRPGSAMPAKVGANLQASCTLDWMTLSEGKEQAAP
jgi:hypothetical protein